MYHTRSKPRKKSSLIIGIMGLLILCSLILLIPPRNIFIIGFFFCVLLVSLFYLLSSLFNQRRRALLISSGITFYLILRALDLRHWLYFILIMAIVISLEMYAHNQSKRP